VSEPCQNCLGTGRFIERKLGSWHQQIRPNLPCAMCRETGRVDPERNAKLAKTGGHLLSLYSPKRKEEK